MAYRERIAQALSIGPAVAGVVRLPLGPRVDLLHLTLADGSVRECVTKRASLHEAYLYRHLLTPEEMGAPALLGTRGDACLLLEYLPPSPGGPVAMADAYRHLARLHQRFAARPLPALSGGPRAVTPGAVADIFGAFPALAPLAPEAAFVLTDGPLTLVHGDYHRWNLVQQGGQVRVLDWEYTAHSHPIWDLVMLEPEGPGQESLPGGVPAEEALRVYHAEGLLSALPWTEFLRLQRIARLFTAARHVLAFRARAAAAPPGPAAVIRAHMEKAEQRVAHLLALLEKA